MAEEGNVIVPELRSRLAVHKSFVRFFNKTDRKVDVIWINYEGHHVKYKTLTPGAFFDINTFATHPWLFIDSETQDKLVVRSEEVFQPEPWYMPYLHLRMEDIPQRLERTHVYITIPLYTLRQRSLQVVRNSLLHPEDAYKLELPDSLQKELADMIRDSMKTRNYVALQNI